MSELDWHTYLNFFKFSFCIPLLDLSKFNCPNWVTSVKSFLKILYLLKDKDSGHIDVQPRTFDSLHMWVHTWLAYFVALVLHFFPNFTSVPESLLHALHLPYGSEGFFKDTLWEEHHCSGVKSMFEGIELYFARIAMYVCTAHNHLHLWNLKLQHIEYSYRHESECTSVIFRIHMYFRFICCVCHCASSGLFTLALLYHFSTIWLIKLHCSWLWEIYWWQTGYSHDIFWLGIFIK